METCVSSTGLKDVYTNTSAWIYFCGKFWLWPNISRRIEASMCSHRLKIRTTHWILGKDLSSGQRCPPFHTTGPKRFVCVVINCFLFSVLIFFTYDPVADPDLQIRGGGAGRVGRSHKKIFSALRASVWCKNKDPGPFLDPPL